MSQDMITGETSIYPNNVYVYKLLPRQLQLTDLMVLR